MATLIAILGVLLVSHGIDQSAGYDFARAWQAMGRLLLPEAMDYYVFVAGVAVMAAYWRRPVLAVGGAFVAGAAPFTVIAYGFAPHAAALQIQLGLLVLVLAVGIRIVAALDQ